MTETEPKLRENFSLSSGIDYVSHCQRLRSVDPKRYQKPFSMFELPLPVLPSNWTWTSLSSVCERVSVGHVGPTSQFFTNENDGIIFIRSQDVRPGKLHFDKCKYITRDFHEKLKKSKLKAGDVLFVRVGANRGDCCVVPDIFQDINCANIVFARPIFPNGYHGFYFRSRFGQELLRSISTGAAQGVLNTQSIASLPVPIPPMTTQGKIAAILSAYDDLIENNLRRIKILEEMAQRLYREWFVNFRFPGHEKVRMVDSPLGKIPQGWEVKTVGEFGSVITGKTPSKRRPEFYGTAVPFIKTPDMHGNIFIIETGEYLSVEGATSQRNKTLPPNSLCVSCIGTVGIVSMTTEPAQTNQQINSIVLGESIYREFLYFALKDLKGIIQQYGATGATMTNLSKGKFESLVIVYPTVEILGRYSKLTSPMFDLIKNLQSKVFVLKGTRDLLLPKLISGELDVAHFACL